MKTLIRKCTEKGVIFQLGARVICFLRPLAGKLQVARKCVEWSAKDCICNNGILYTVQSTPLPELLDSTLILLRESKFNGRFIPNRCPLKMSVFSKENDSLRGRRLKGMGKGVLGSSLARGLVP